MQIIEKPWGKEEVLEVNDKYMMKRLTMLKGRRCSLQYHVKKHETVYLLSGRLRLLFGPSVHRLEDKVFEPGDFISIQPRVVHRMEALEDSVYFEASTPEMDDVIRLSDDYKRIR